MNLFNRLCLGIAVILITGAIFGQKPVSKPASAPVQPPSLTTADRIAIQSLEQKKDEARKEYEAASQAEVAIEREWQQAHPGYQIDSTTFAITKIGAKK